MDPISQGALGASLSQAAARRGKQVIAASLVGAIGGMVPDLDVLMRSSTDPLLFLEYHRQFTHSLIFIPIGGVLTGLLLFFVFGRILGLTLKSTVLFTTLGYATHALLDACTTYGTQLLWPFSNARVAWNTVSIIDPLFTLPLLVCITLGLVKKRPLYSRVGLAYGLCYLLLGLVQRDRAETVGWQLAQSRGHAPIRLEAKPSFGNLLLWKIVYETETHFYIDAVRVLNQSKLYPGEAARKLDLAADFPWLKPTSQQYQDVQRFDWFSNHYLALDPKTPNRIIDTRYSMVPNEISPLWGIELNPTATAEQHVVYYTARDTGPEKQQKFWQMLTGEDLD
ncbi:metal-dependent hydrolase [Halioxenophilus aromaticivorans]|uniref:Metal-dependent hydrolase n=1 Tax=Halioxenophilus aromaticivorans TaxID=1306992 RepID=A0AAV3U9W3_9ALTE